MTAPAVDMAGTAAEQPMRDRAETLLRRQLIVTVLGVALMLVVMAFVRSQDVPAAAGPVDRYVQAHQPPDPGNASLAYAQLVVAAVVAIVALGHAAHVVAFVFRRKVS